MSYPFSKEFGGCGLYGQVNRLSAIQLAQIIIVDLFFAKQGIRSVVAVNDSELAAAFNTASSDWQEQWVYYPGQCID